MIIGREFDPEFDSGCYLCDEEFPMRELFYSPETGDHTCEKCHYQQAFEKSIKDVDFIGVL